MKGTLIGLATLAVTSTTFGHSLYANYIINNSFKGTIYVYAKDNLAESNSNPQGHPISVQHGSHRHDTISMRFPKRNDDTSPQLLVFKKVGGELQPVCTIDISLALMQKGIVSYLNSDATFPPGTEKPPLCYISNFSYKHDDFSSIQLSVDLAPPM